MTIRSLYKNPSLVTALLVWILLTIEPLDRLFDERMALHMLLQVPLLLLAGVLAGRSLSHTFGARLDPHGLSSLFFFLGTLAFWMLPLSFDAAVVNSWHDLLMHINLFVAGALLPGAIGRMSFAVRAAAGIYLTAMLATAAMVYLNSQSLICNVYTIEMQKETGRCLLWALPLFFLLHMITLLRTLHARNS